MGQCNYCTMQQIKRDAKLNYKKVITRDGTGQLGGTDVFVVPQNTSVPEKIVNDNVFSTKYFVAWFMKLPDHCAC